MLLTLVVDVWEILVHAQALKTYVGKQNIYSLDGADIEHNQKLCADITMTSEYVLTSLLYRHIIFDYAQCLHRHKTFMAGLPEVAIWRQSGDFEGVSGARIIWRFATQKVAIFALLLKTTKKWRFLGKVGDFCDFFINVSFSNILRESSREYKWHLPSNVCHPDIFFLNSSLNEEI